MATGATRSESGTWASDLARVLPAARPGFALTQPARSLRRLLAHGAGGWVLAVVIRAVVMRFAGIGAAIAVHAVLAPIVFAAIAWHYFGARGSRDPLPAAASFAGIVAGLDLAVAVLAGGTAALLGSVAGFWVPLALIFLVSWGVGGLMSTMPWRPREEGGSAAAR